MIPLNDSKHCRSALVGGLLLATASIVPAGHGVLAETKAVGVFVTFAERIEVRQASVETAARGEHGIARTDAVAEPGTAVAALAVRATPGRAVTLIVDAPASMALVCSYGGRRAPCDPHGMAAVSAADASVTVSIDPVQPPKQAAKARGAETIDITIAYP